MQPTTKPGWDYSAGVVYVSNTPLLSQNSLVSVLNRSKLSQNSLVSVQNRSKLSQNSLVRQRPPTISHSQSVDLNCFSKWKKVKYQLQISAVKQICCANILSVNFSLFWKKMTCSCLKDAFGSLCLTSTRGSARMALDKILNILWKNIPSLFPAFCQRISTWRSKDNWICLTVHLRCSMRLIYNQQPGIKEWD